MRAPLILVATSFALTAAVAGACLPSRVPPPVAPVPPTIIVTVDNESPWPATIVVRRVSDPAVVGLAEPSIIAPRSKAMVTLTVPRAEPWEVVANPVDPRNGGLFGSSDLGTCRGELPIVIHIQADGNPSWSAPDRFC